MKGASGETPELHAGGDRGSPRGSTGRDCSGLGCRKGLDRRCQLGLVYRWEREFFRGPTNGETVTIPSADPSPLLTISTAMVQASQWNGGVAVTVAARDGVLLKLQ